MDLYSNNKLPVFQILSDVIILTLEHSFTLFRFGAPFLIFNMLILFSSTIYTPQEDTFTLENILVYILVSIVYFGTMIMAIIGCHRTFLLNSESISNTKTLRFSGREIRFIGWLILIMLCVILIMLPSAFLLAIAARSVSGALVLQIILPIFQWYIFSRLSLVLPATAIDERNFTISSAWNISSGNGWRLTLLVGLLPFAIGLLLSFLPEYDSIFYYLIIWFVSIIISVIEIGLLSLSYSYLSKHANKNNYLQ
jgi:hypothetical protein